MKALFILFLALSFAATCNAQSKTKSDSMFGIFSGLAIYGIGVSYDAYSTRHAPDHSVRFNQLGGRMIAGFGLTIAAYNLFAYRSERLQMKSTANGVSLVYKF